MIFRGKKGWIHGIMIWGSEFILLGVAYFAEVSWLWALPILFGLLFAWVWFFTFYKMAEKELTVYYGPAVEHIKYHEISRVTVCKNFKSSAALSLDRLEIRHTGGLMTNSYIAPKEREKFIAELKVRAPKAHYILTPPKKKKRGEPKEPDPKQPVKKDPPAKNTPRKK